MADEPRSYEYRVRVFAENLRVEEEDLSESLKYLDRLLRDGSKDFLESNTRDREDVRTRLHHFKSLASKFYNLFPELKPAEQSTTEHGRD